MENLREWHKERMMERTVKALLSNYFDAHFFTDRTSLLESIMYHVYPGMTIGIGGSLSIRGIGLLENLAQIDVEVLDHWKQGLTKEDIDVIRLAQLTCDLFLSSANAITFGPKKVIIIAGYNKITPDINSALDRIKRIAAPLNAKRLNMPLPCAETGYCHDCKVEARICRITSIIQRRPIGTNISVYLINEELGL